MNFLLGVACGLSPLVIWAFWLNWQREKSADANHTYECHWCSKVFTVAESWEVHDRRCLIAYLDIGMVMLYALIRWPWMKSKLSL